MPRTPSLLAAPKVFAPASLRKVLALGAVAVLVGAIGCLNLEGRPCDGNADCVDGYQCIDQVCQQEDDVTGCSEPEDCPATQSCLSERCVADAEPESADGGPDDAGVDGGAAAEPEPEPEPTPGPQPEPVPEPAPTPEPVDAGILLSNVQNFDVDTDADTIEVFNPSGGADVIGDAAEGVLSVTATIFYPESLQSRLGEIAIDIDAGGSTAEVATSVPNGAAFEDVIVDLEVHVSSAFAACVFPGSARPVSVTDLLGGVDVSNVGDVTLDGSDGEIIIDSETGDIDVTTPLTEGVDLTTVSGDIALSVPSGSEFSLDARYSLQGSATITGFTLLGANTGGVAAGIVGTFRGGNDHQVDLNATQGSISISAY